MEAGSGSGFDLSSLMQILQQIAPMLGGQQQKQTQAPASSEIAQDTDTYRRVNDMSAISFAPGNPKEDFEREVQEWIAWRGTPPFINSPAWEEAQRRKRGGIGGSGPSDFLGSLVRMLTQGAQPRSDIVTPGSTGKLENARPYTYAGRVGNANSPQSPQQMLQRSPVGELEAGSQGIEALKTLTGSMGAGMTPKLFGAGMKQFKNVPEFSELPKGFRNVAKLAHRNTVPETPIEKMFPAYINLDTGEVVHAMAATGPGGHKMISDIVKPDGFRRWTHGFVDPKTFEAYTDVMLEDILVRKHFGDMR